MQKDRIAVFIDAENLTSWLKNGGVATLMSELHLLGQTIVRKAYGKWTNQGLAAMQEPLNRDGFELIHSYHPVSGKNSTDIQMTVEAMECSLKISDIKWIVLATGDSDFSPLFRKLREIGKEVIGVGPKSPLSECVKTSCSRYIYTDENTAQEKDEAIELEKYDALGLLEDYMKSLDGPVLYSNLKSAMIQIDNAFNEKRLGYANFSEFIKSIEFIESERDSNGHPVARYSPKNSASNQIQYRQILKTKQWEYIPKALLEKIYISAQGAGKCPKPLLAEYVINQNIEGTTSSLINKALGILFKSKLVSISSAGANDEKSWKILPNNGYLELIDRALLIRLVAGIKEQSLAIDKNTIHTILYRAYSDSQLNDLISEAIHQCDQRSMASAK